MNGAIAVSGFLLAGFHGVTWLAPLAVVLQVAVVWFIYKLMDGRGGDTA